MRSSSSSFFGLKIELLFVFFCFFFPRFSVGYLACFSARFRRLLQCFWQSHSWEIWFFFKQMVSLAYQSSPPPPHFSFLILFSPPCHIRKPLSLFCYFFHLLISSIFWGSDIILRYPSIRRSFLHVTHVFSPHDEYFPVDVRGGGCFIKSWILCSARGVIISHFISGFGLEPWQPREPPSPPLTVIPD